MKLDGLHSRRAAAAALLIIAGAPSLLGCNPVVSLGANGAAGGSCAGATGDGAPPAPDCPSGPDVVKLAGGQGNSDWAQDMTVDETFVYWTSSSVENEAPSQLQRTPKCGGPTEVLHTGPDVGVPLLAGAERLYWIGDESGSILSMPKGGGPVTPLLVLSDQTITDLAIDCQNAYFTTWPSPLWPEGPWIGGVYSLPLTGGVPTLLSKARLPVSVAVDETSVYFAEGTRIMHISKATAEVTVLAELLVFPLRIIVGEGALFAVEVPNPDKSFNSIVRVDVLDGTTATIAVNINIPAFTTAHAGFVYWSEGVEGPPFQIHRAPVLGGVVQVVYAGGLAGAVRADDSGLYWLEADSGGLFRKPQP